MRNRKVVVAAGALALSSAGLTLATGDLSEVAGKSLDVLPWVGAGVVVSETAFIAGGALMVAAAGRKMYASRRVRKNLTNLNDTLIKGEEQSQARLAESKLFKTGFALNATGAVGFTSTLAAGVVHSLPPESWGVLGIGALEIAQTLSTRAAIWGAIRPDKKNAESNSTSAEAAASIAEGSATDAAADGEDGEVSTARVEQTSAVDSARAAIDDAYASAETAKQQAEPAPKDTNLTAPKVISEQKEKIKDKVEVRAATEADIEQIVDLDLKMFRKAYGQEVPTREAVAEMMASRLRNIQRGGGWMTTCIVNGRVEGFLTAFRTNKSQEQFTSWEYSTSNGTLDGVVDPHGKYVYVANLTVGAQASKNRGRERLMAASIGKVIQNGKIEYAYFESRMPWFGKWLNKQGIDPKELDEAVLDEYAQQYVDFTVTRSGEEVAVDPQIRMYEKSGMKKGVLVPNAFNDPESLDYGIVFTAPLPNIPRPFNKIAGILLALTAKMPKVSGKLF